MIGGDGVVQHEKIDLFLHDLPGTEVRQHVLTAALNAETGRY